MKKLIAAVALLCALTFATTAAAVDFGANDDTGKYAEDGGATFFGQMRSANLQQNVMTVRWTPGSAAVTDAGFLDRAVPQALAAGITPIFAIYPYPPSAIEAGAASAGAFGDWVRALAQRYPEVRTYIVGNEPNLNTFWRPQGDGAGTVLSGASFGPFLAAGYDALKAVSPGITVLGVGSSPRGERAPASAGKSSPVHFLASLGAWYRGSGRPTPLMDGFSFHPYPNPSDFTVPLSFTYGWPNASVQELPRIKQALWDAFSGTAQPTTLQGLKLYLDEVGWQVSTEGNGAYSGAENVKVTDEANQAAIYDQLIRYVVCDPDVAQLNFFGYWDEHDRAGWQSALRRADGTERASNAAVAAAIAATGGSCQGRLRSWAPLSRPDGASVAFAATPKPKAKVTSKKAKPKRALSAKGPKPGKIVLRYVATASEDVTVKAGIVPASTPAAQIPALLADAGSVDAYRKPPRTVVGAAAERSVLAVLLSAKLNPARTALFLGPAFGDAPAKAKAAPKGKPKTTPKPKGKPKPQK